MVNNGNEPKQAKQQETAWRMESVTGIREDVSVTAEIAAISVLERRQIDTSIRQQNMRYVTLKVKSRCHTV
jgi:hypothetical protein